MAFTDRDPPTTKFKPLKQVLVFERRGEIVFRTMTPDAFLLLPDFPLGHGSFVMLKMELTAPDSTTFFVSYETEKGPGFSPMRTVLNVLEPGRNTIFLAIPAQGLKGRLVLHPGNSPGDYVLYSLEIRASNQ